MYGHVPPNLISFLAWLELLRKNGGHFENAYFDLREPLNGFSWNLKCGWTGMHWAWSFIIRVILWLEKKMAAILNSAHLENKLDGEYCFIDIWEIWDIDVGIYVLNMLRSSGDVFDMIWPFSKKWRPFCLCTTSLTFENHFVNLYETWHIGKLLYTECGIQVWKESSLYKTNGGHFEKMRILT